VIKSDNPNMHKIIPLHKPSISRTALSLVVVALAGVTVAGFLTMDYGGGDLASAGLKTIRYFILMFGSPRAVPSHFATFGLEHLPTIVAALRFIGITLALAFLTTVIGGVVSLVFGLLSARNLSSARISNFIKSLVSIIRAIPTVLWVLIFAIGAGLGSVAAVIGMSFHTSGQLIKNYSESFEEIDPGVIEALRSSGASWFQIVFQAVLPSTISYLLSWTFIRFETNFEVAVAMGAAAGAGGIGYQLFMAGAYFFDIREIGYISYLILVFAMLMEFVSTRIKHKLHLHD
jgi:phosphonate transport system permease protein